MIFVLTMLVTFVYDRKNENHWSLLVIRYSLLIIRNTNTPEIDCKALSKKQRKKFTLLNKP